MTDEQLQDPDADWDREDPPVETVIPTDVVKAALEDPSTELLRYGGPAAKLLLLLAEHFAGEYGRAAPTLIVRAAKP